MTADSSSISFRRTALIAGWSLVAMALLAGFSYGYVFNRLFVPGKDFETTTNIHSNESLFIAGWLGFLLVLLLDIITALALHAFFRRVNRKLSKLTALLRLIYGGFLAYALYRLLNVLFIATDFGGLTSVDAFQQIWSVGLIVFGCHLILLGCLAFASGFVPKIWSVLLFIAGVCYLFSNGLQQLWPGYEAIKSTVDSILSLPMIVGELGFAIWLVVRGGKAK